MIVTAAVPAAKNDEISPPMAASTIEAATAAFIGASLVGSVGGVAEGVELAGAEADGATAGRDGEAA